MVNRWCSFFYLFVIATGVLMGQDSREQFVRIAWESEGSQFNVEIRRDGQIFLNVATDKNEIKVKLAPGVYEYRINVLSPFGKTLTSTGWESLDVKRPNPPYFRVKRLLKVKANQTNIEFPIEGFDSSREASFFLVKDSARLEVKGVRSGDDFLIQTGTQPIPVGIWSLESVGLFGAVYKHPEVLEVFDPEIFSITETIPDTISGKGRVAVAIKGKGFAKDMNVVFNGPDGELSIVDFVVESQESATVYFEMKNAKMGSYGIVATNTDGSRALKEAVLTVVPPSEQPRYAPRIELHIGYMPLAAFPQNKLFPLILSLEGAVLIQPSWFTPFLKSLGLELHGFFGSTVLEAGGRTSFLGGYDASLYWRPRVKINLSPVILIGFGNIHTISSSFTDKNLPYLRMGAAMDFEKVRRITRVGFNVLLAIGRTTTYPMITFTLRVGYRM